VANLPLTNLTPTINCTGSHRIVVSTSAESGQLTVTVRPRDPHDDLLELRFGSATRPLVNALLDLPDGRHGVSQGTTYAANGGAPSITFNVRRQQAGPVTVPLTVVDRCPTPWETFVGGGSGAF